MIDLSSKDYSYTTLKVNEIKRLLKKIKPDISELTSSDVINISLLVFAYLCEGDFMQTEGNDITIELFDDLVIIDVENLTLQLKFKNYLVNSLLDNNELDETLKKFETIKELVKGDDE